MPKDVMNTERFIKKATVLFKDKYDYSLAEFYDWNTKLMIMCKHHGQFKIRPGAHLRKSVGCPKCRNAQVTCWTRTSKRTILKHQA